MLWVRLWAVLYAESREIDGFDGVRTCLSDECRRNARPDTQAERQKESLDTPHAHMQVDNRLPKAPIMVAR